LVRGLGAAVDRQFEDWGLTAAEKEVAGLLIKGLSLKELLYNSLKNTVVF
jgi:DNA-binding CsgD family transcriptional regulator